MMAELGKIKLEELSDEGTELYVGVLLLDDLIKNGKLEEGFKIRCTNLRNRWIGLLSFD